jgi:beta-lactamase class D
MSTEKPRPPFVLPKKPTDRFEVKWFRVNTTCDIPTVSERKAVYFVRCLYEDAFPEGGRRGVPLVDDWMVFEDGHASGRWVATHEHTGWEAASRPGDWWVGCFATEEEACAYAAEICRKRIAWNEKKIAELRGALVRLTYDGGE